VVLATTPYLHGYEVKDVHDLKYATAESVGKALNLLREYALDSNSNAVVGILISQSTSLTQTEAVGSQIIAYGTAMKISRPTS